MGEEVKKRQAIENKSDLLLADARKTPIIHRWSGFFSGFYDISPLREWLCCQSKIDGLII